MDVADAEDLRAGQVLDIPLLKGAFDLFSFGLSFTRLSYEIIYTRSSGPAPRHSRELIELAGPKAMAFAYSLFPLSGHVQTV